MVRVQRMIRRAGWQSGRAAGWKAQPWAIAGGAVAAVLALAPMPTALGQTSPAGQAPAGQTGQASSPAAPDEAMRAAQAAIGRAATPAEVKAWDIDVRADFQGLPPGKGDVALGEEVWEAKCAVCHGTFGESNEVFTPIVGGTTAEDVKSGRVDTLEHGGYPHRTTLMKLSKLSSLWDYINRAMPWNAPKSLSTDEVYGVVAYILNLGDIVPADFTLSNENMAQTQALLPNRNGKVTFTGLWETRGKPDVAATACMKDCSTGDGKVEVLPLAARGTHGNIAQQVRPFGAVRGTETEEAGEGSGAAAQEVAKEAGEKVGEKAGEKAAGEKTAAVASAAAGSAAAPGAGGAAGADSSGGDGAALVKANACIACHGIANKIVGPGFQEIGKKYDGKADVVSYLAGKMMKGSQGVWGPIPMPAQAQLEEADAKAIAAWIAGGAR